MADMKQIHDFAVKWCDKFRDQNINYIELVDHYMADDCDTLGFKMDFGHAFSEKYGNAANNHEALDRIIADVTDIPLLGSAIYSKWQYFNHWAYTGAKNFGVEKSCVVYSGIKQTGIAVRGESFYIPKAHSKEGYVSYQIISAMDLCRNPMKR